MKKSRHTIHWQLTLHIGSVICLLMLLFLVVDGAQQKRHLIESRAASMEQEIQLLGMTIQRTTDPSRRGEFLEAYCATMRFHGRPGHALAILDRGGRFHSTGADLTHEDVLNSSIVKDLSSSNSGTLQRVERTGKGLQLVVAHALLPAAGATSSMVYYSEPLDDVQSLSRTILLHRSGVLLLLLVAVVVIIWFFVKHKVTAPLSVLLMHEYAASKGDLRPKEHLDPHNEITDVCNMFNHMLAKIQDREHFITGVDEQMTVADSIRVMAEALARVLKVAHMLADKSLDMPQDAQATVRMLESEAAKLQQLVKTVEAKLGQPDLEETL